MPHPKPASRSEATRTNPCPQKVKFTEAQNNRLHKVCKRRGVTVQAFLHDAALVALAKAEEEYDRRQEREEGPRREPRRRASVGLGIRDRIDQVRADASDAPPPMVVNVQAAAPAAASDTAVLAGFVANGSRAERDQRWARVRNIVQQGAPSGDAMRAAMQAIEAEVTRIETRAERIEAEPRKLSALEWLRGER